MTELAPTPQNVLGDGLEVGRIENNAGNFSAQTQFSITPIIIQANRKPVRDRTRLSLMGSQ